MKRVFVIKQGGLEEFLKELEKDASQFLKSDISYMGDERIKYYDEVKKNQIETSKSPENIRLILKESDKNKIDRDIDKEATYQLKSGVLTTSKVYYFTYDAKGAEERTLEVYDKTPLICPLSIFIRKPANGDTTMYLLAVNFHWISDAKKRKKMFDYIVSTYSDTEVYITKKNKTMNMKKLKLLYKNIKSDSTLQPCIQAIRLYIVKRIKNLKVVPIKHYDKLFSNKASALRARFLYLSKNYKTGKVK